MSSDEYILDTAVVHSFIAGVRDSIAESQSPEAACAAIRPAFETLLADQSWLPDELATPVPGSGMGGGIGQWLLYRTSNGSLSLFSLVVPSGAATPVHDHLAWGLVGLYRGEQDEEIYAREGEELRLVERRALHAGDFYALFPPHDDIHRVRTTSAETSVSIHLLTNDTGCVWRHSFDPESGAESPFRSGYANAACEGKSEGHWLGAT
jgi:predicted metal-dependent enzyme (double-stranded beta helix superfamily)